MYNEYLYNEVVYNRDLITHPIIKIYLEGVDVTSQTKLADFSIEDQLDGVSTSTVRMNG